MKELSIWVLENPYTLQVVCLSVGVAILIDSAFFHPPHTGPAWINTALGVCNVIMGTVGIVRIRGILRRRREREANDMLFNRRKEM